MNAWNYLHDRNISVIQGRPLGPHDNSPISRERGAGDRVQLHGQPVNQSYLHNEASIKKKKLWAPQLSNTLAIFSHFNNGRVIHPEDKESFTF